MLLWPEIHKALLSYEAFNILGNIILSPLCRNDTCSVYVTTLVEVTILIPVRFQCSCQTQQSFTYLTKYMSGKWFSKISSFQILLLYNVWSWFYYVVIKCEPFHHSVSGMYYLLGYNYNYASERISRNSFGEGIYSLLYCTLIL